MQETTEELLRSYWAGILTTSQEDHETNTYKSSLPASPRPPTFLFSLSIFSAAQ